MELRARRRSVPPALRYVAWMVSVAGNNLPDLDLVYSGITSGKLGYLLHHRGHTHTLVAVPLEAALVLLCAWAFARSRKISWEASDWRWLTTIAILAPITHLGLDAMNNYGVHPFWPLDRHWYYGDTLFIIEPFLWLTLSLGLFQLLRVPLAMLSVVTLLMSWFTGYVPVSVAAALTIWAGLLAWRVRVSRSGQASFCLCLALLGILGFGAISYSVKRSFRAFHSSTFSDYVLHDVILTPMPANPFCWALITVESDRSSFRLRRGTIASLPRVFSARHCPVIRGTEPTLPLTPVSSGVEDWISWQGEWTTRLAELESATRAYCAFSAFLHYARAPFLIREEASIIGGDLRFDWDKSLGFAELEVSRAKCPRNVPNWIGPRESLITPKSHVD